MLRPIPHGNREMVRRPAGDRGSRLDPEHPALVRRSIVDCLIERQPVGDGGDVHLRDKTACYGIGHPRCTGRDRTPGPRIKGMDKRLHLCIELRAGGRFLLADFISHRPHDNARMIAAQAHELLQVTLPPLVKEEVVAVLAFGLAPGIERLGQHHHTHFVAYFEKPARRRIVRSAYRIAPHILQDGHLATERIFGKRRAQRTQVVMETHALERATLAVQPKASGIILNRTETETLARDIHRHASDGNGRLQSIEDRRLGAPRFGTSHAQRRCTGCNTCAIRIQHAIGNARIRTAGIAQLCCHSNRLQIGSEDRLPVGCDSDSTTPAQAHWPIYPSPRIPTRTARTIRHLHGKQATARQNDFKRRITKLPLANLLSIQKHFRLAHYPVEHQRGPCGAFGNFDTPTVFAGAYPR